MTQPDNHGYYPIPKSDANGNVPLYWDPQTGSSTPPNVSFNEPEATQTYTQTQGALDDHARAIPSHDPTGIEDDDISAAVNKHNDKTKSNIGAADKSLSDGNTAVRGLGDEDRASGARTSRIDPTTAAALSALQRPAAPAAPFMPAAPAMTAPAAPVVPQMPAMPQMPPNTVSVAPDALARLLYNAHIAPAAHTSGNGTKGLSVSAIPIDPNNPKQGLQSYLVAEGARLGLTPTEIGMAWAVAQHENGWNPEQPGFMGFGPEAKAAGYNLDGNPKAAIDQYFKQYIDRIPSNLDRNNPEQIAYYIHHTVHNAADGAYTQELEATYPGPLTWNGNT